MSNMLAWRTKLECSQMSSLGTRRFDVSTLPLLEIWAAVLPLKKTDSHQEKEFIEMVRLNSRKLQTNSLFHLFVPSIVQSWSTFVTFMKHSFRLCHKLVASGCPTVAARAVPGWRPGSAWLLWSGTTWKPVTSAMEQLVAPGTWQWRWGLGCFWDESF